MVKKIPAIPMEEEAPSFIFKYYSSKSQLFFVTEKKGPGLDNIEHSFKLFDDFYNFLNGDLSDAYLYDFNFDGLDLTKYNLTGVELKSDLLDKHGLYDDYYYRKNLGKLNISTDLKLSSDTTSIDTTNHSPKFPSKPNLIINNPQNIYYISDIHLDYKLHEKFPIRATRYEIICYMRELAQDMISNYDFTWNDFLLIAGDISHSSDLAILFLKILSGEFGKKVMCGRIIVVLGNHEIANINDYEKNSENKLTIDDIVEKYKSSFRSYAVEILHNDLLIVSAKYMSNSTKYIATSITIISEKKLGSYSPAKLKSLCDQSSLIVFGGLGFSGLNKDMNASHGMYHKTITNLKEDIKETKKFNKLYCKLNKYLKDYQLIILTHTPKDYWSDAPFNSNWIYINGHTHINTYTLTDELKHFADNQIGYKRKKLGLKHFYTSFDYDVFAKYEDGIYDISYKEYLDFYRGKKIPFEYKKKENKIIMVKKKEIYAFFCKKPNKDKLYLLEGGKARIIKNQDINYYYENLDSYYLAAKNILSNYYNYLITISNSIKKFGGKGTIHGSIIDINSLNHVYVNPNDYSLTPYYALSVKNKYVYPSVEKLLSEANEELYHRYLELPEDIKAPILPKSKFDTPMLIYDETQGNDSVPLYVEDTIIYTTSNKLKKFQYMFELNIVRVWDEKLISQYRDFQNNNTNITLK